MGCQTPPLRHATGQSFPALTCWRRYNTPLGAHSGQFPASYSYRSRDGVEKMNNCALFMDRDYGSTSIFNSLQIFC
jgi:hypothetical protein